MRFQKIDPRKIKVSDSYQRMVKQSDVTRIVRDYLPEAFAVLTVGKRRSGALYCVDGQTRLAASIKLGLRTVGCMVFASEGRAHEARVFRMLNRQRAVSALDKLKAMLEEGDPDTVAMVEEVKRAGFRISASNGWPNIRSVTPVIFAYEKGVLSDTLSLIREAYGGSNNADALKSPVLHGAALFLSQYRSVIDLGRLASILYRNMPRDLISSCDARRMSSGSRPLAMRDTIVELWNRGLARRNRIEMTGSTDDL